MRKSPILEALFPGTRSAILAATILQPDRIWFLTELAGFLETQPSSLQREVDSLSRAGILRAWRDGRRLYLAANRGCPIFEHLAGLFEKTSGVVPVIQQELSALADRVACAFVFGSLARSEEGSASDIDLLVVGRLGLADLALPLERAEARLGRIINPVMFSADEFQARLERRDHFVESVMGSPRLAIFGDAHDLATVA